MTHFAQWYTMVLCVEGMQLLANAQLMQRFQGDHLQKYNLIHYFKPTFG